MTDNTKTVRIPAVTGSGSALTGAWESETVRRYAMTRKSRRNWLRRYMNLSDEDNFEEEAMLSIADRRRRTKKSKILLAVIMLALAAAAAFPLVSLVLNQLSVKNVIVSGQSRYALNELSEAAGIAEGDKLFGFSPAVASSRICEMLPYVRSCRITRTLSGNVTVEVTAEKAVAYTSVAGDYYALSSDLRVLERSADAGAFIAGGLIYTELPDSVETVVGNTLVFASPEGKDYVRDILKTVEGNADSLGISELFLAEKFGLVAICEERYSVLLGSPSDLKVKLATASRIIGRNELEEGKFGVVDVKTEGSAGFSEAGSLKKS